MGNVIFNNYSYEFSVSFKKRDASQMERVINSLNQDLPPTKEWNKFLLNYKNKLQIVNLLVYYIKSGRILDKAVIVNQGSECFFIEHGNGCVCFPELDSLHMEINQKIPMHAALMLAGKTMIQFALLPVIWMSIKAWSIFPIISVLTSISDKGKPRTKME